MAAFDARLVDFEDAACSSQDLKCASLSSQVLEGFEPFVFQLAAHSGATLLPFAVRCLHFCKLLFCRLCRGQSETVSVHLSQLGIHSSLIPYIPFLALLFEGYLPFGCGSCGNHATGHKAYENYIGQPAMVCFSEVFAEFGFEGQQKFIYNQSVTKNMPMTILPITYRYFQAPRG